ncbi:hypothetical protein PN36_02985 [Candidatus Thiomargarita nelsonii]|uniref:Uncharacterized protein n=1 Tax=Candidatus Thiomargarita nelsonii TaxID=1003181 RepID=A0A0A6PFK9_9GAMM|nr:hypothetical protein PN36_02985 [Candidatus Thiomargarita nelsonii]
MLDMFIQIPGPTFLIYLILFSIFCIVIGKRWIKAADDSNQYSMPDVTSLNSNEIAALRDGRKGVIQTALFDLWNRKLITSRGKADQAEVKSVLNQQLKGEIDENQPIFFQTPACVHVLIAISNLSIGTWNNCISSLPSINSNRLS